VREVRRAELVAAIGRPCAYCGDPMAAPTRDHIHPRSKGGTLAHGKVLACLRCNGDKGAGRLDRGCTDSARPAIGGQISSRNSWQRAAPSLVHARWRFHQKRNRQRIRHLLEG